MDRGCEESVVRGELRDPDLHKPVGREGCRKPNRKEVVREGGSAAGCSEGGRCVERDRIEFGAYELGSVSAHLFRGEGAKGGYAFVDYLGRNWIFGMECPCSRAGARGKRK